MEINEQLEFEFVKSNLHRLEGKNNEKGLPIYRLILGEPQYGIEGNSEYTKFIDTKHNKNLECLVGTEGFIDFTLSSKFLKGENGIIESTFIPNIFCVYDILKKKLKETKNNEISGFLLDYVIKFV